MIDKEVEKYINELTPETVFELAALFGPMVTSEAWKEYEHLLSAHQHGARITGFSDAAEQFKYWQGYVNGVAAASEMIKEILAASSHMAKKEEAKGKAARRLPLAEDTDLTF